MANRDEQRGRFYSLASALLVAVACLATPLRAQDASLSPLKGGAFGDTATFGVRIVSLDTRRELATFTAKKYKHIIVLAVIPGREIEIISPGPGVVRAGKGKDTRLVSMQRIDEERPADADENAQARLAYDRCIAQAEAAARRAEAARRNVKRDSTGRVVDDGRGTPSTVSTMDYTRQCDRLSKPNQSRKVKFMPPREPADRYLVVLSSTEAVEPAQLYERLQTLTAVAPDVATTLEAIAAGLFVGTRGTWAGYYVAW